MALCHGILALSGRNGGSQPPDRLLPEPGIFMKLSRNRNYTEGELILQLQILAKKIGRSPTTREVGADPDTAAPVTFTQHFGSWDCALHAAGLERRKKR